MTEPRALVQFWMVGQVLSKLQRNFFSHTFCCGKLESLCQRSYSHHVKSIFHVYFESSSGADGGKTYSICLSNKMDNFVSQLNINLEKTHTVGLDFQSANIDFHIVHSIFGISLAVYAQSSLSVVYLFVVQQLCWTFRFRVHWFVTHSKNTLCNSIRYSMFNFTLFSLSLSLVQTACFVSIHLHIFQIAVFTIGYLVVMWHFWLLVNWAVVVFLAPHIYLCNFVHISRSIYVFLYGVVSHLLCLCKFYDKIS